MQYNRDSPSAHDLPCGANAVYEKHSTLAIDAQAIAWNIDKIRTCTDKRIIAVIKENGYGIGLYNAFAILQNHGIDFFAVSASKEALALRAFGWTGDILLMTPVPDLQTCAALIAAGITLALTSPEQAVMLRRAALICGKPAQVHLKIDSGFGRYGFPAEALTQIRSALDGLRVTGCFTHFPVHSGGRLRQACRRFMTCATALFPNSDHHPLLHGACSGVLTATGDLGLDAVRVGSLLLGRGSHIPGFQNAVTLQAKIITTKCLSRGDPVGYGAAVRCRRNTLAGIVPVGFGDGLLLRPYSFPEELPHRIRTAIRQLLHAEAPFAVCRGHRLPILGRSGVGHITLDLTGTGVHCGDTVSLAVNPLLVHPAVRRAVFPGEAVHP